MEYLNCYSSRAVYVDLSDSYNTDSFINVMRRFVSIHGYPKKIRSDAGSQLVATSKEIKEFGRNHGMHWEFTKSADAPWENGCSEALIKSVKRCLTGAIGSSVMTFSELQTVLFEVGNLINQRPIGTKSNDPNDGTYLCPNDLLLGRASTDVPMGEWDVKDNYRYRWKFVQEIVNSFWKKWSRDYFSTLLIRQKWHTETRNVQVGDIVIVQEQGIPRGKWKMAVVKIADTGNDNRVRDVTLRYKNLQDGLNYTGERDICVKRSVHRLVVILPIEEQ